MFMCREISYFAVQSTNGSQPEKTCLWGINNNTGAEQPAHLRSLISVFVFRFLESIICKLATDETCFVGHPANRFSRNETQITKMLINRLIYVSVVNMQQNQFFSQRGHI